MIVQQRSDMAAISKNKKHFLESGGTFQHTMKTLDFHNKKVTEATHIVYRLDRANHPYTAMLLLHKLRVRSIKGSFCLCIPIQNKNAQYLTKGHPIYVPLCNGKQGQANDSSIQRLDFYKECFQWNLNESTEICPFCSSCFCLSLFLFVVRSLAW